jgi:hypothetical protein
MRKFRNKKTGKIMELDEHMDRHLIEKLESETDIWKELIII